MPKEVYYFSHDSNARHDPKITAMRSVYGAEGYGWYWILVEMMRECDGYRLDIRKEYLYHAYAKQMECKSMSDAKKFIDDCVNEFELFVSDGFFLWSNSLYRRMKKRDEVVEKRRDAANARWGKTNEAAASEELHNDLAEGDSMQMHSTSNAYAMQTDADAMQTDAIKGKESKGIKDIKSIKEKDRKHIYIEIIDYLNEKANTKFKFQTIDTQRIINARLNEKFTVEDFKTVIDKKCAEWIGTVQQVYLTPQTLFSAKHFEIYLHQMTTVGGGGEGGGFPNAGGSGGQFKGRSRAENPVDKIKSTDGWQKYPKRGETTV